MRRVALAGAGLYLVFIFRLLLQLGEVGMGEGVAGVVSATFRRVFVANVLEASPHLLGGHSVIEADQVGSHENAADADDCQYCV